jgi:hypothetical protein
VPTPDPADGPPVIRLCWRHGLRLNWVSFWSLLDPTGHIYVSRGIRILQDAKQCPDCLSKNGMSR